MARKIISTSLLGRGGFRAYRTASGRRRAVAQLRRHGHNYFVGYHQAGGDFSYGLDFGHADWIAKGSYPYIKDI